MKGALHCMNHTLYPEILLPVTALVLAGATCMGYINFNENLLQLQLQLQFYTRLQLIDSNKKYFLLFYRYFLHSETQLCASASVFISHLSLC